MIGTAPDRSVPESRCWQATRAPGWVGHHLPRRGMGLRGDLSRLLDRRVDLVMPSAVRNRYIAREIAATREHVYGA
jgi:hypothetical protein